MVETHFSDVISDVTRVGGEEECLEEEQQHDMQGGVLFRRPCCFDERGSFEGLSY